MLNFLVFNPYSHSSLHQWSYLPQSGTKISEQHIKILGRISSNDVRCIHLPSLKIYHICREYQPYLSIPCRNSRNRSIIVASTFIQSSQPLSLPKTWRNRNLLLSRTSIFDRVETIISISFIKLETDEHYETGSFFSPLSFLTVSFIPWCCWTTSRFQKCTFLKANLSRKLKQKWVFWRFF